MSAADEDSFRQRVYDGASASLSKVMGFSGPDDTEPDTKATTTGSFGEELKPESSATEKEARKGDEL